MEKETNNEWMCKGKTCGWRSDVTENFKSSHSPASWKNSAEISKKSRELEKAKITYNRNSEYSVCKERPIGHKQVSLWNTGQDIIEMELMRRRRLDMSEWICREKNRWKWILRFL